jgi:hypothetical protein
VLGDHPLLELMVLLQSAPALLQPLAAVTRNRLGVRFAAGV